MFHHWFTNRWPHHWSRYLAFTKLVWTKIRIEISKMVMSDSPNIQQAWWFSNFDVISNLMLRLDSCPLTSRAANRRFHRMSELGDDEILIIHFRNNGLQMHWINLHKQTERTLKWRQHDIRHCPMRRCFQSLIVGLLQNPMFPPVIFTSHD